MWSIEELTKDRLNDFQEKFLPSQKPVVIRGLVEDWPILASSDEDSEKVLTQLVREICEDRVRVVESESKEDGYIGYSQGLDRLNFSRKTMSFSVFVERLIQLSQLSNVKSLVIQSAYVDELFPQLANELSMPLFDGAVRPRVWIGNRTKVGAHCDDADNIACVLMGRRRFTLFPPEQIKNLYIGPIDHTPAGAPTSLARTEPDFAAFPKLREAYREAYQAVLHPGDAIFIPTLWWHQVESLSNINMLVNYWRGGAIGNPEDGSVFDALLHTLSAIQTLPEAKRHAWGVFFDHFVFRKNGDPAAHIPDNFRGMLGGMSKEQRKGLNAYLRKKLGEGDD